MSCTLYCLPSAGGGASMFSTWQAMLPPSIQVSPVHLPGREHRFGDPPMPAIEPLIADLAGAVVKHSRGNIAIFGHSMGALLGFELARQLSTSHRVRPIALFVSAYRAPHLADRNSPLRASSDSELIVALRELGGLPEPLLEDSEFLGAIVPALRADLTMCETYVHVPAAPLDFRVSAFGGRDDPRVADRELRAWGELTTGPFSLRMLPGGHFFLEDERASLLAAITRDIALSLTG